MSRSFTCVAKGLCVIILEALVYEWLQRTFRLVIWGPSTHTHRDVSLQSKLNTVKLLETGLYFSTYMTQYEFVCY